MQDFIATSVLIMKSSCLQKNSDGCKIILTKQNHLSKVTQKNHERVEEISVLALQKHQSE